MKALRAGMAVWRNYLKKDLPRTKWKRLIRSLTVKQDNVSTERRSAISDRIAGLVEAGVDVVSAKRTASRELRKADQFGMVIGVTGAARKYAHIVEFGGRIKRQIADGSWRRAVSSSMNRKVVDAVGSKIKTELAAEMNKL